MLNNRYYDKEKYFGKREYQEKSDELFENNAQKSFSDTEKEAMLHEMVNYIEQKKFELYHDFMDKISKDKEDWFNFVCFDRKAQNYLLTYIKTRVQKLHTNHTACYDVNLEINEKCYRKGILLKRNCDTCEFNTELVCAGYGKRMDNGELTYGMPMDEAKKMFPNGCADYGISFLAYEELQRKYWDE